MAKANAAKLKKLCVVVPFPKKPTRTPTEELIDGVEAAIRMNQFNVEYLTERLEEFKAATRGKDPKKAS